MLKEDEITKLKQMGKICPTFHLKKATRIVSKIFDKNMKKIGINTGQFSLLSTLLIVKKSINITNLSTIMAMDRTTLTRNLKNLEKLKCITINKNKDDFRIKEFHVTDKGIDKIRKGIDAWDTSYNELKKIFDEDFLSVLIKHLNIIEKSGLPV